MVGKRSEDDGMSLEEMEEGWKRTCGEKKVKAECGDVCRFAVGFSSLLF